MKNITWFVNSQKNSVIDHKTEKKLVEYLFKIKNINLCMLVITLLFVNYFNNNATAQIISYDKNTSQIEQNIYRQKIQQKTEENIKIYPYMEGGITFDTILNITNTNSQKCTDEKCQNDTETEKIATLEGEIDGTLQVNPDMALNYTLIMEGLDHPIQKYNESWAFLPNIGLMIEQLNMSFYNDYFGVLIGKFNPTFGIILDLDDDIGVDYEITEKYGGTLQFFPSIGDSVTNEIQISFFSNLATNGSKPNLLDRSLFTPKNQDDIPKVNSGLPGDHKSFKSYSISYNAEINLTNASVFKIQLAYLNLYLNKQYAELNQTKPLENKLTNQQSYLLSMVVEHQFSKDFSNVVAFEGVNSLGEIDEDINAQVKKTYLAFFNKLYMFDKLNWMMMYKMVNTDDKEKRIKLEKALITTVGMNVMEGSEVIAGYEKIWEDDTSIPQNDTFFLKWRYSTDFGLSLEPNTRK